MSSNLNFYYINAEECFCYKFLAKDVFQRLALLFIILQYIPNQAFRVDLTKVAAGVHYQESRKTSVLEGTFLLLKCRFSVFCTISQ